MKIHFALILSLFGFALAAPLVMAEETTAPATEATPKTIPPLFDGYLAISDALFQDDLAATKEAAAAMVKLDQAGPLSPAAKAIAESTKIADARNHFVTLSEVAIPIAKKLEILHVAHCPMASENQGADWLQASADQVQNPYMGQAMPRCGSIKK